MKLVKLENYCKYKKVFVKRRNINFVKKDKESLFVKTTQNLEYNFTTVNELLVDDMFMNLSRNKCKNRS